MSDKQLSKLKKHLINKIFRCIETDHDVKQSSFDTTVINKYNIKKRHNNKNQIYNYYLSDDLVQLLVIDTDSDTIILNKYPLSILNTVYLTLI